MLAARAWTHLGLAAAADRGRQRRPLRGLKRAFRRRIAAEAGAFLPPARKIATPGGPVPLSRDAAWRDKNDQNEPCADPDRADRHDGRLRQGAAAAARPGAEPGGAGLHRPGRRRSPPSMRRRSPSRRWRRPRRATRSTAWWRAASATTAWPRPTAPSGASSRSSAEGRRTRGVSAAAGLAPYAPLGVLKPLGRDIWMVDGPVVRARRLLGTLPLTTRMTVARLPDGRLWLHAPVDADPLPRAGDRRARAGGGPGAAGAAVRRRARRLAGGLSLGGDLVRAGAGRDGGGVRLAHRPRAGRRAAFGLERGDRAGAGAGRVSDRGGLPAPGEPHPGPERPRAQLRARPRAGRAAAAGAAPRRVRSARRPTSGSPASAGGARCARRWRRSSAGGPTGWCRRTAGPGCATARRSCAGRWPGPGRGDSLSSGDRSGDSAAEGYGRCAVAGDAADAGGACAGGARRRRRRATTAEVAACAAAVAAHVGKGVDAVSASWTGTTEAGTGIVTVSDAQGAGAERVHTCEVDGAGRVLAIRHPGA